MNYKKRLGIGVTVIVLLFAIAQCSPKGRETEMINPEEDILRIMKEDEKVLFSLYDRSDICSEKWIVEFKAVSIKMQQYSYSGEDEEIINLLKDYKFYGEDLESIALILNENNYAQGIQELENLKKIAVKNEKELNRLYEKVNQ